VNALPNIARLLLYLLAMAALLAGSYTVQRRMNRMRVEHELTDTELAENAPPVVVFTTVALGSFRGLVADMLWLYSRRMQDEGNYFEMYQLASWMVKLQPRFTGATAFLAWNMAYNISVTFSGFEERWRWVQRGIELIRDEALVYNPGDPELYKELGWIYQHKLGQEMDDANRYYKLMLARQMVTVLGGYPVDWEAWAQADAEGNALRDLFGERPEMEELFARHGYDWKRLEREFRMAGLFPEKLGESLAEAGLRETVELALRVRWMRQELKLEPTFIHHLVEKYGDLDWRLPEAHAIYWASKGLNEDNDLVNLACERMIFQSLSNAFRGGRLAYMGELGTLEVTPNIAVVDAVNQQYLDSMANHPDNRSVASGYRNWLIDTIVTLYSFGAESKAGEYLGKLREQSDDPAYRVPLERFVLREMAGDIETATFDQAHSIVQGLVFQGFVALAVGDDERAATFDRLAKGAWLKYMQDIGSGRSQERRKLPPLKEMRTTMYERRRQIFPPDIRASLERAAAAREAAGKKED
jgi:hypothetical protein